MEWIELSRRGVRIEEPRAESGMHYSVAILMGYTYQAQGIWSVGQADIARIVQKTLISSSSEWTFSSKAKSRLTSNQNSCSNAA